MNKYRTQYYDFGDLAIPNELMKCEEVLNDFGKWNSYKSIDPVSYTHLTLPTTPYV